MVDMTRREVLAAALAGVTGPLRAVAAAAKPVRIQKVELFAIRIPVSKAETEAGVYNSYPVVKIVTDAGINGYSAPAGVSGLADIVERIELTGDGAEPLRCELASFVAAARGEAPVAVTGKQGRDALAVALEIIQRIERHVVETGPALA